MSSAIGSILTEVSTAIIAVATVVYVVFTIGLWRETKKSADAAKTSADMGAALHRPYLGVPVLTLYNSPNPGSWVVRWEVKNFGTLPACDVRIQIRHLLNGCDQGPRFDQGPCEIFPGSTVQGFVQNIPVDGRALNSLLNGNWKLVAEATVSYAQSADRSWTHTSVFVFDGKMANFRLERSRTSSSGSSE
jgi:hypothetical protein